jgi:hypothetical protein
MNYCTLFHGIEDAIDRIRDRQRKTGRELAKLGAGVHQSWGVGEETQGLHGLKKPAFFLFVIGERRCNTMTDIRK